MNQKRSKRNRIAAAVIGVAISFSTAAHAEDVFVKLPQANILAGKGAGSDRVAQVKKGEKLQVLAHEGSWLKVKVGNQEGYVHQNSVSTSDQGGDGGGGLSKLLGTASGASGASSAEAGRGLGEALAYARSTDMSPAGLDRMLALRKTVSGADWERFTSEGNVGPAKR